jgi:hypothetical protein
MFETYHEGDSFVLRTFILYSVLTGIYWTYPPLGSLWLLFSPKTLINSEFRTGNYKKGRTGSAGILRNLNLRSKKIINTMRLEVIFIILVQVSLFYFLNLKFTDWLLCYLGFALQWSGLQYADHAYSPRDIRNGAWNLKVSKLTQYLFLNYHYHLAHHQHPHVPWIHLPKFVDPSIETPSFFKIYLRMWKGLEKDTRDEPKDIDPELEKLIDYTPSSYADNPIKLNQATK